MQECLVTIVRTVCLSERRGNAVRVHLHLWYGCTCRRATRAFLERIVGVNNRGVELTACAYISDFF